MQCFTCRKNIPLGSSCWPITNRIAQFRTSSPPTVCDDCFKCSVCRVQLTLDKYGAVGKELFCSEHEPPASSIQSSTGKAAESSSSSAITSSLFSFFSPAAQTSTPTISLSASTPSFPSLFLNFSSPPLASTNPPLSPRALSPRQSVQSPRADTAVRFSFSPATGSTASSASATATTSSSAGSSSTPSNVFTVPSFTPSAAAAAGPADVAARGPRLRRNSGTGGARSRISRTNKALSSSTPTQTAVLQIPVTFSSSPFPSNHPSSAPYAATAAPPTGSAAATSSSASTSSSSLASPSLSATGSPKQPRHLRGSSESGHAAFGRLTEPPTSPVAVPSHVASASFLTVATPGLPRQTWPPPGFRARSPDPDPVPSVPVAPPGPAIDNDGGAEAGSLIDKRRRRVKRSGQASHSNATVPEMIENGDMEVRLKQLAAQLEMVRLEKAEELDDASADGGGKAQTKDEELAMLRTRLAVASRKAEQAEARAKQAEDRAVRYQSHIEVMQQVVDNTLKALHDVEAVAREMGKLQRELASVKEERAEIAARAKEYREVAEHMTRCDQEHIKEINKLKGNFSPRDYTIEELIHIENTLDEGKRKVSEVRVAMQVSVEEKKKKECVLCFDEQKDTVFVPCGHLACCRTCSKQVSKCPICRKAISHTVPVYDC